MITPHYFLFSESRNSPRDDRTSGEWRFVLESVDGTGKLEVVDQEPLVAGERLELLAVVRGLEALDQPSRVTLITPSRYVSRGLRHGLQAWRENDWQWERFGQMTPIKNGDLWQRIDRAMDFHQVECRYWRFDSAHQEQSSEEPSRPAPGTKQTGPRILQPLRNLLAAWQTAGQPTKQDPRESAVPRPKGLFAHKSRKIQPSHHARAQQGR